MTQTNPEQWAVELFKRLEKMVFQSPAGTCLDGEAIYVIQAAFAEQNARLVGNEREAIINWLRGGAGTDTTTLAKPMRILFLRGLHSYADAIERGDHIAALKDRTND